MNYSKYFKQQQKVLLHTINSAEHAPSAGVISARVIFCGEEVIEFSIPYPLFSGSNGEGTFLPEQTFVVMSECFGLGLKLTGRLTGILANGIIRLKPADDLELFSRRAYPRSDVMAGLSCVHCSGPLDSCRKQWHVAVQRLASETGRPSNIERMVINLSAGGICMPLQPPMVKGEHCLLFLELDNCKITTWTLSEVVWTRAMETGLQLTGLRFIEITVKDQLLINNFVVGDLQRQGFSIDWNLLKKAAINTMHFDSQFEGQPLVRGDSSSVVD